MAKKNSKASKANADTVRKSRDQLVEDLKRVLEDVHALTEESKEASGAAIQKKFQSVHDDLDERVHAIQEAGEKVVARIEQCTDSVEETIRAHPWRSLAVAAVAGLVIDRIFRR